jgi:hypothetical protein
VLGDSRRSRVPVATWRCRCPAHRRRRLGTKAGPDGTIVTLSSTSTPTGTSRPITGTHWDLDGKPGFDTRSRAGSITATSTAPAPGTWTVTVRVVDGVGDRTSNPTPVQVPAPPPPPEPPPSNQPLNRGCPVRRAERLVGREPVRFPVLKRLMPAGVGIEVLVHCGDSIERHTGVKLWLNRNRQRSDGCLCRRPIRMTPCAEA